MSNENRIIERLNDLGFRTTEPRRRVVHALCEREEPFSAEELYEELRQQDDGVGRATVFRTLDLLAGLRMLDRVHRPDGSHLYVYSGGPGHRHHLVCSACGSIVPFDDCNVADLVAELSERTHFRIEGHWLELYGVCERCQKLTA